MAEYVSKFNAGELIAMVAIVGGLLCGLVVLVADYWHKIRKAEIAAKLKHDMLDRGMSADEIRIVLEAGSKKSHSAGLLG